MTNYGRFQLKSETFYGEIQGEEITQLEGKPFDGIVRTNKKHRLGDLKVLVPVEPSKIIAVGLNFADHAKETGKDVPSEPLIWLKAPSSLLEHRGTIRIGYPEHRTDFEAELCIVIGKKAKNVSQKEASHHIFGYTCSQDVSDRHVQKGESQWARAKSMDTYTPVGPFIRTDLDPSNLSIQLTQNGDLKQNSSTSQMIFPAPVLVEFISRHMTLLPGDIILTGTPPGIAPIKAGDQLEVRIEGLEPLSNQVG